MGWFVQKYHRQSALMHCNELQLRGVKVEAMAIKFEQRVAEEVAKAGFRAKPGPRHNKEIKGTIGRGKTNHNSEWTSGCFWKKNPSKIQLQ
jgi:hypothetical protein